MDSSDITLIANPLYDVVFRYMMEDNRVAKLFVSAVIDQQVEALTFRPTAFSDKIGGDRGITVIRMDFHARIKQEDGSEKVVIIELQKAKFYYQMMRFRNYLGKQYQNKSHFIEATKTALPVFPVYILGEAFTQEKIPVIRICREYIDPATESTIAERHPFIEALTHDAVVIQTPHIAGSRRNRLEKFLSIFDQTTISDEKGHILALDEQGFPEDYRLVVRRLNKALQTPEIESNMEVEDQMLNELHYRDQQLAESKKQIAEQQQRVEEQKKRAEAEQQRAEEEKRRADEADQALHQTVLYLHNSKVPVEEIARITGKPVAEIQALISRANDT